MKNYVQYHNTAKQGRLVVMPGEFRIFAKKSIRQLIGNRVWLISSQGIRSPKAYFLEYQFTVEDVRAGAPNYAIGSSGIRFSPAIPLDNRTWFRDFRAQQQNFSLGVREIQDEFVAEFEKLGGL